MAETPKQSPFFGFGEKLREIRQTKKQSQAEVSGAVEIDIEELDKLENGLLRPTEDVLFMLISHFNIRADQAGILWKLAGYDDQSSQSTPEVNQQQSVVVMMSLDSRIVYSDDVEIDINDKGVVLNFSQPGTQGVNNPIAIARIGMSHRQAAETLKKLQTSLLKAHYKSVRTSLPASTNPSKRQSKSNKSKKQ